MPTPPIVMNAPVDPSIAHENHVNEVMDKLAGVPLNKVGEILTPPAPAAPQQVAKTLTMTLAPDPEEGAPEASGEAPEAITEEPAPTAPVKATPTSPSPQDRLSRSARIQKNAREAAERARTGFNRMKAKPPAPAPRGNQNEVEQSALRQEADRLARVKNDLDREIRLAKTDPMGFARRHGVSGADIAKFVRDGTDPNSLKIEDLERRAAAEIQKVRNEYRQELDSIKQTFQQSQEQTVQQNFFEFVEDAKDSNPEAFAALDTIFSEKEVWDTANRLLEERADLRDGFDEDKLLEAIEVEARQDPRWVKIQKRITPATSTKQTNVKTQGKTNASEQEVTPAAKAPVQRQSPSRERNQDGTFVRTSPQERHDKHLEGVIQRLRFGG